MASKRNKCISQLLQQLGKWLIYMNREIKYMQLIYADDTFKNYRLADLNDFRLFKLKDRGGVVGWTNPSG